MNGEEKSETRERRTIGFDRQHSISLNSRMNRFVESESFLASLSELVDFDCILRLT